MAFALDVLVKFIVTYGGAVLGSLGFVVLGGIAYVIEFAILAVAMATLNGVYLLLGQRAVAALDGRLIVPYQKTKSDVDTSGKSPS